MKGKAFIGLTRPVIVFAVAGALLTGAVAGASTRAAKPQKGGTLTVLKVAEQGAGWDPGQMLGVPFNSEVPGGFAIYDVLFYQDPQTQKLQPRIGQSLTTSDGGTTWTLKLRPNVKFSDGTPFDAEAVRFNWARLADPTTTPKPLKNPSVPALEIQSMQVVDATTLKIALKSVDPIFNLRATYNLSSVASPTALKALGASYGTTPVGAGPFVLKEWIKDVQQTYVRNEKYWETGQPYLDSLVVKFVLDDSQRLSTIQTGGGDVGVFFDPTYITTAEQAKLKTIPMSMPGGGWGVIFNNAKAPFNDARMRQAMALGIDRKHVVDTRRGGDPDLMVTHAVQEGSPYYDASLKLPKYDPAGAQKLIDAYVAEHGGQPVSFTLMNLTAGYGPLDVQEIQAQLLRLKNLDVKLETVQSTTGIARYTAGDYQAYLGGVRWNEPATDLVGWYSSTGGQNVERYSNPTVDALSAQLLVATDQKEKIRLHHDLVQQVLKDVPNIFLTKFISLQIVNKTVQNFPLYFDQRILSDQATLRKPKG
jgi:peptide/nickel transport system substrate-binding protein